MLDLNDFIIVGGLLITLFVMWVIYVQFYRRHARDKSILTEIFEGSTSARLVTDIQDKVIFFNPAFQDLCVNGEVPNLTIIRRLFVNEHDSMVQERLESLIQNAMRGHEDAMEA